MPKLVLQQRRVAEMVLGKPGTPEFDEFVKVQREQVLAGTLPAPVLLQWLNYLTGKPTEHVEIKDATEEFEGVTIEQLRERALEIVSRSKDSNLSDEAIH